MVAKILMIRSTYLEVEQQEPLLKKSSLDINKEFNFEQMQSMFQMIQ